MNTDDSPTEKESTEISGGRKNTWKEKLVAALLVVALAGNVVLALMFLRMRGNYNDLYSVHGEEYFVFPSLPVDTFERKVAAGDEFIAYVSRPDCPSCQRISADFMDFCTSLGIADKIYYVNVVYLHRSADDWTSFKEKYQLTGTPSIVRFAEGEVYAALSWTEEKGAPIEMMKDWVLAQDDYLGLAH